jgi:hypothetical protein
VADIEKATREELEAALAARKELGRDYEPALVESFLDKIDQRIDARVDARVDERTKGMRKSDKAAGERQMVLGFVSLGTGIPITAIAGADDRGVAGIVVAWLGIAAINVAHALASRRSSD